jgi:hypothetical protein
MSLSHVDVSEPLAELPLDDQERDDLQRLESLVDRNFESWLRICDAIREINERRLYRESHPSFAEYMRDRFNFHKAHAYRLIQASRTVEELAGHSVTPTSETQIRPLVSLPQEEKIKAWDKAVELAGGEQPSAAIVKKAAHGLQQESPRGDSAEEPIIVAPDEIEVLIPGGDDERAAIAGEGSVSDPVESHVEGDPDDPEADDQAFLATLKVRDKLTPRCRVGFDHDVLAYRRAMDTYMPELRRAYLEADRTRPIGAPLGAFVSRLFTFHRIPHPRGGNNVSGNRESGWLACMDCFNQQEGGSTGYIRGTKTNCPSCRGRGYTIPGA